MLGGIDPILIFHIKYGLPAEVAQSVAGVPLTGQETVGSEIPIPIILNEKLTGLMIDSTSKSIDVKTDAYSTTDEKKTIVLQYPLDSSVTVNISCKKGATLLTVLLTLCDLLVDKIASKNYAITYLNGSTTVFRGLLNTFSYSEDAGTTKAQITLNLSKVNQGVTTPKDPITTVGKVEGEVPLTGQGG